MCRSIGMVTYLYNDGVLGFVTLPSRHMFTAIGSVGMKPPATGSAVVPAGNHEAVEKDLRVTAEINVGAHPAPCHSNAHPKHVNFGLRSDSSRSSGCPF